MQLGLECAASAAPCPRYSIDELAKKSYRINHIVKILIDRYGLAFSKKLTAMKK